MKKCLNLIATILMLNIEVHCGGTFVYTIDGDDLAVNKLITQSVARENQNKTLFCYVGGADRFKLTIDWYYQPDETQYTENNLGIHVAGGKSKECGKK